MVSWLEAAAFCDHLNDQEGYPRRYDIRGKRAVLLKQSHGYRLPTEAEWEFACRAGSGAAYPFGENLSLLTNYAWYAENSHATFDADSEPNDDSDFVVRAVGQKAPNAFGLFDMLGNHWEWVEDAYLPVRDLPQPWLNPSFDDMVTKHRISRGGFAGSVAEDLRCARRRVHLINMTYPQGGFRIVLSLPQH